MTPVPFCFNNAEAGLRISQVDQTQLNELFDKQAPGYDQQWAKMSPIRECLHFLLESYFALLPEDASILCVGVGTGTELAHLAQRFPRWCFTAVDPSEKMIEMCRQKAERGGFAARCEFQAGYVESLPAGPAFDGATCFLVSQFILDQEARSRFFAEIAARLKPGGVLASSDLASDVNSTEYQVRLEAWMKMMAGADISEEAQARMRAAYAKDVAILPSPAISSIIQTGGFESSVPFFQAGLIQAWVSRTPD